MTDPKRTRALPKVRKAFGTSANIDGDVLVYSEGEMATFGDACFQDGRRAAMDALRAALSQAGFMAARITDADRIQAEETAWGDFNAGRGPHPIRKR